MDENPTAQRKTTGDRVVTRRQMLVILGAGVGAAAIGTGLYLTSSGDGDGRRANPASGTTRPEIPLDEPPSDIPWTEYLGAVQTRPSWGTVQRHGTFYGPDGDLDPASLQAVLATHGVLIGGSPRASLGTADGVAGLMDRVAESGGAWWRDQTRDWIAALTEAHADTPNKVLALSTGNEVNAEVFGTSIRAWAAANDLAYPHPRSDYGDGDRAHSRDHIGYYVEYVLAPAVEGARLANDRQPPENRIPVMLGTLFGSPGLSVPDEFLPALVDYEIEGTFAPSLAGQRVADVVDYLGLQYVLTPEVIFGYHDAGAPSAYGYRDALDDLHARWLGHGRIRGIWLTEEGGNLAQQADRHASVALRVFARSTSWVLANGLQPDQHRVLGYYVGPPDGWDEYAPRTETSWEFAMQILHEFLGHDQTLIDRSENVEATVVSDDPTEAYAFETGDRSRRVVFVTPQSGQWQGPTELTSVSVAFDGWDSPAGASLTAEAHLFKSDAEGHARFSLPVRRESDRFHISLPQPVALNANADMQVLMIQLERG